MKLPRAIWALGFVSLFTDIASESVHSLLPVFLVSVLGVSFTSVGILEGMSEAITLGVKVFSGPLSDWLGRRRILVLIGYGFGVVSKPLFALSYSLFFIYAARFIDRTGKGIRDAPRDALIAEIAPPSLRGRAYGLRQSMDNIGAFLGPIFAIGIMWWTHNNYRMVFWLATIPALISLATLYFYISDPKETAINSNSRKINFKSIQRFSRSFWFVALTGVVFQVSRFSEAFLILRVKDLGLGPELLPLVIMALNFVYALSSYPIGSLSDRYRREWFLGAGFLILTLANLLLGLGTNLVLMFLGVCLWGLHLGFTQSTLAALVADHSPPDLRGTAFGLFNLFSALALIVANTLAGLLWDLRGAKVTFLTGAGFSTVSLILLVMTLWPTRCYKESANGQSKTKA